MKHVSTGLIIALILIVCVLMYFLNSVQGDSKSSIATLVGALIGAIALFIGNQVANWNTKNEANEKLEADRKLLRNLLIQEVVTIFINHAQEAKFYKSFLEARAAEPVGAGVIFDRDYTVRKPLVYEKLLEKLLVLRNDELNALVNLYHNLDQTRLKLEVINATPNYRLNLLTATELFNTFSYDCELAANVVEGMCPERRVEFQNGRSEVLSLLLRHCDRMPN